jgi:acetyl esterase/lipase
MITAHMSTNEIEVVENALSFGGDLTKGFLVAGVSAGANMTATIAHLYRDEGRQPPITGLSLSIPSLLAPEAVPESIRDEYRSREENKDGLVVNAKAIKLFRCEILTACWTWN